MNAILYFNPRTPVGCDGSGFITGTTFLISIHAPQWGATSGPSQILPSKPFQSTHPSGVRLPGAAHVVIDGTISIHAPQWGATRRRPGEDHLCVISIHAPQWGATRRVSHWRYRQTISIHAPQWGATSKSSMPPNVSRISIHAPQWGATRWRQASHRRTIHFNPRTPVGCDWPRTNILSSHSQFQSTHPSGVRHNSDMLAKVAEAFQSTHPSGVRRTPTQATPAAARFQSTHPSGVRLAGISQLPFTSEISIHAPQWGATGTHTPLLVIIAHFNPRTPVGCDAQLAAPVSTFTRFQSTHPSGVRRFLVQTREQFLQISIHAPQWGATTRMGIAFHNMEAPSVLKTDFIAKIHVHRSIHKFSNQKHQQTIHF